MIVEINKVYTLSAPKATEGMTPGDDDFIQGKMFGTYVKMKRVNDGEVITLSKVFNYKDLLLQVVIFITDLPVDEAKRRLNDRIKEQLKQASKKD